MSVDERKQALVRYCSEGDRVCPQPLRWQEFWRLIGEPKDEGVEVPFILGGWAFSTDREKRGRFQSHLRYAVENGLLDAAERFIASLGEQDWHTCPPDRMDWSYGEEIGKE
ncbi:MAG TPA: hypothetical protein PK271_04810 [Hyphomicrobium sp.]|uniref:hypothetical protein n=1 Tax=Hyphomicrobium sp. TaxID=82 RepID=UPI002BB764FE|nr:hypothetical protein [Hyphomicrobium sp.]HRN87902.1 hypothetical protein [Hyphomicrobium sp.]